MNSRVIAAAPQLTVVLVAGSQRKRAQRVVDALALQTAVQSIELVIVDLGRAGARRLEVSAQLQHTVLARPDIGRWGAARAAGARVARAPVVAFIEDHCFPVPDWAEIVIDAHRGPWVAVGYAFTNANPETYVSRSSLMARYGNFVHPALRGPAPILSGNNISYKLALLLEFGPELDTLLAIDFNLQELLGARGEPMFVEARALAAHQNFTSVIKESVTGHHYCRLLAARRAETQSWSMLRRLIHGLGAPLGSPAIRVARLLMGLRGRPGLLPTVLAGLPVILAEYTWDAVGESLGYLLGAGDSERSTLQWELETSRTGEAG